MATKPHKSQQHLDKLTESSLVLPKGLLLRYGHAITAGQLKRIRAGATVLLDNNPGDTFD